MLKSINNTSFKVKPNVRLYDNNKWYLFTKLKYNSSKKALSLYM
jgi:hypothetical protein